MKRLFSNFLLAASCWLASATAYAQLETPQSNKLDIDGTQDPITAVEQWSNSSTYKKIFDINFSDEELFRSTWQGETSKDCPDYTTDAAKLYNGYASTVVEVPVNGSEEQTFPMNFYRCTFNPKGTTAAFARIYLLGENVSQRTVGTRTFKNNWKDKGHTVMIEDDVQYDSEGYPSSAKGGFVQMNRAKVNGSTLAEKKVNLGWVEIDHIPYVERVQWAWSSTSMGRGIKMEYKTGSGRWKPVVFMGSEKDKQGFTPYSDQGYYMENVLNLEDVSLRWRIWDGENANPQQTYNGEVLFNTADQELTWYQAARLHKIQIFGNEISTDQSQYARDNKNCDIGEATDMTIFGGSAADDEKPAPDDNAPVVIYTVAQDGSGDFTAIQPAIDAVKTGERGIIYIRKGTYYGQVWSGTKDNHNKYISLIGEDRDNTILTYDKYMGGSDNLTFDQTSPLLVYTDRFHAENLSLVNSWGAAGNGGQAMALYTHGDAHTFTNCKLVGFQDTYKSNSGSRGYFKDCYIEGAVDFIYDSGTEWFEKCQINSVRGGYVLAAGKADNHWSKSVYPYISQKVLNVGLTFNNCDFTANSGVSGVYLGRTWDNQGGMIIMNSRLGSHFKAEGWTGMGDTDVTTVTCAEYNNTDASGNAADVSKRVSWSYQLTKEEVDAYLNADYVFKKANKSVAFNYSKILAGHAVPNNFVKDGNRFVWDQEDAAPAYIIYKDGAFLQIITAPDFTVPEDGAKYTVAAISTQGVVSEAVAIKETIKQLAFPTAEGFGKYASGGRGGKVVVVTNLEDDLLGGKTEGSLRWAIKQYPNEPLTVVFNVSGWIILKEPLKIKRNNLTIAGQTAPGEGITLYPRGLSINGSKNVIIRNIRSRCSSKGYDGADVIKDASLVDQAFNAENAENVIIDHCTFGWSGEEVVNNQTSHYQTYSYCMVHEPLYDAGHHKGSARGFGAQWGGSQTTMHHNLMAHCNSRSPRIQGARDTDYIVYDEWMNNVNFNWGSWGACYGGENNQTGRYSGHEVNFCNNYYQPGPATNAAVSASNAKYIRATAGSAVSNWYLAGNVYKGNSTVTNNNASGFAIDGSSDKVKLMSEFIVPMKFYPGYEFNWAEFTIKDKLQSAAEAFSDVLANVGCVVRDGIETRICNEAKNGTASHSGSYRSSMKNSGIIDDPSDLTDEMTVEASGFISYKYEKKDQRAANYDTDNDGIADDWERANGLTVGIDDHNALNEDGYTALEVFLNSLMGETMKTGFVTAVKGYTTITGNARNVYYNLAGQRVSNSYRGIVVRSGKKALVR